jgi:hypothetical protein
VRRAPCSHKIWPIIMALSRTTWMPLLLVLAGCGGLFQDAATGSSATGTASGPVTPVPAEFACWDDKSGIQALAYDKACRTDDECTVVILVRDCCGSQAALGVPRSQRDRVERWSRRCSGRRCGCAASDTQTDTATVLAGSIEVRCIGGQCLSYPQGEPPPRP